ncbi:bifunctional folylpolyglutamate synthase/dihydrofolate synthase [Candidatus Trichorickettsia mobilis]|uniref:bifunctional folylpolyglutamate synthase/dihydrofolate synthase n=1 Tax=Candidatus Trichorickettsia mobilis TaxID=1346319 RepID=UPI0029319E99|nr:folylpolyglutamate synthase/dihydrofolate synthase family protein [Candidatus Trichorickettsia mobilis]
MRMPHWPTLPWQQNPKYDLENILQLLKILESPHQSTPPVIHIAGTNGKGSTVAILKSIFEAANYKVHAYTSPHLIEFNERIILAGEQITDHYLFEICERTRKASETLNMQPRFFEAVTAASFLAFSEVKADILLLETGLGGRLDATNVITQPLLTLITPISYDHTEYLGNSLQVIAAEKAGIIKPNVPCVISCQLEEVYEVLLNKCNNAGSPAFCYEYDFIIFKNNKHSFQYSTANIRQHFSAPSLLGDHQLINAAAVIAAISLINQQFHITKQQIDTGLQNAVWPARIQKIDQAKYAHLISNRAQIWLDGAHNSNGAQALAHWIRYNLTAPTYLILGMTKNRNIKDFCSHFYGIIIKGYTVKVLSEPSSYGANMLAEQASCIGMVFSPAEGLIEAINQIAKQTQNTTINIVICGSLFLAADFLKLIQGLSS